MGKARTNKFYRTFSKGLITEASYLTYPEDASSDEQNTILSRKGNRSRRLGVDYQEGFVLNEIPADEDVATNEFVWHSVNNDPNVSFLCQQVGYRIYLFRMNNLPLSSQKADFTINIFDHKIPSASTDEFTSHYADMSAGSGFLFVAHRFMDPLSVEYKPETDSLVVIPIVIQIRDFEGVYDGLANDAEPHTLSAQHHYNLMNQGWVTPGTPTVDISTPNYGGVGVPGDTGGGGDPSIGGSGEVYYDPYTGGVRNVDTNANTNVEIA